MLAARLDSPTRRQNDWTLPRPTMEHTTVSRCGGSGCHPGAGAASERAAFEERNGATRAREERLGDPRGRGGGGALTARPVHEGEDVDEDAGAEHAGYAAKGRSGSALGMTCEWGPSRGGVCGEGSRVEEAGQEDLVRGRCEADHEEVEEEDDFGEG